jgi:hypothetical protein
MFRKCFRILTKMIKSFEAFADERMMNQRTVTKELKEIIKTENKQIAKERQVLSQKMMES